MKTTLTINGLGYSIYAQTDRYSAYQIASAIVNANCVNTGNIDLYDAIMSNDVFHWTFGKLTIETVRS